MSLSPPPYFIAQRDRSRLIVLAITALLAGCAVGPDFKRPDPPKSASYTPGSLPTATAAASVAAGEAQRFSTTQDIRFDWWTLFRSPKLNTLIERSFRANPSIDAAQAALRQAQENVIAQQGYFYPTVSVSYAPSRNMLAGNMGGNSPGVQGNGRVIATGSNPPPPYGTNTTGGHYNGPVTYNFHVAQLNIGYVPDVFGLNRRQTESAQAQADEMRFQLEATYITLASNVVAAALQEAGLREQLAAVKGFIATNRESLDIMRKQLALGFIAQIDVAGQEALLAQAEQALPPLEKQLEQTRDLIRALAGNAPSEEVAETFTLADIQLPQELPLSLPSQMIEHRPDVRAAEEELHAATAQYGVSIANRLPQFNITAALGGMAASPDWMFRPGGPFYNIIGNIAQTVFDGGTLRAQSRAAQQAMLQAAAQYRGTVIAALQNVADTLHAIQSDADTLKAADTSERATKSVLELTRKQYDSGQVSYQILLLAQQNYQLTVINRVQAQSARLGDTAALYQALGGGWWHRQDTAVPSAKTPLAVVGERVST
jgi:NodT family efflux transporter outer membrane factor (OMF) lipoprotein